MATWFRELVEPNPSPAPFRIEFICFVDGYSEPEVIETIEGAFKGLDAAIAEANRIAPTIRRAARIDGFRVAEGSGPWIAHRFRGEPWFTTWAPTS
jgi:hypothetical protein